MARRTKVQIREDEKEAELRKQKQQASIDALTQYGLNLGDKVRFRRHAGGKWTQGKAAYMNSDDSVCIISENGFASIIHEQIERRVKGPRGGVVWSALKKDENDGF